jgi:PKD repeat protein
MRIAHRRLALLAVALAAVGVPVAAGAAGWWLADTLSVDTRDSFLPGLPLVVRVDLLDPSGRVDRAVWDAEVALSVSPSNATISPARVTLRNGAGSALVTVAGAGNVTLTARLAGLETSRALRSLAGEPVTAVGGTLPGASTLWHGIVHVTNDVAVPAGHVLTIDAGTLVLLDGVATGTAGKDINVAGTLRSLGTAAAPVTFTAADPTKPWGEIHHANAAPSLYQYTHITLAGRSPTGGHTLSGPALRIEHSDVTFERCVVSDLVGKVMQASLGNSLVFRESMLLRAVMGPECEASAVLLEDCWVGEMHGPNDDDGLYFHTQSAGQVIAVRRCVVADNYDDAIDTLRATISVSDCIIRDNADTGITIYGAETRVTNCLIVRNFTGVSAKESGANTAIMSLTHCTLADNTVGLHANDKFGAPAARILYSATNCIIGAGEVTHDAVLTDYDPADIRLTHCNVGEPWAGAGNLSADPRYLSRAGGNYRLQPASPCIDAGADTGASPDLDGAARPQGVSPDIGAYEAGALRADFEAVTPRSGRSPLAVMFSAALSGGAASGTWFEWDLDGDGAIDRSGTGLVSVVHSYTNIGVYAVSLAVSHAGAMAGELKPGYVSVTPEPATTYVAPGGLHLYPYGSWATAATNLQAAVDAAPSNTTVYVSNGIYRAAAEVHVGKPLTVLGVNGAAETILDGGNVARAVYLEHAGAVLRGFTVRNGRSPIGGGVYVAAGTVDACRIVSNTVYGTSTTSDGGGVYLAAGLVQHCVIARNTAGDDGGGVFCDGAGVVRACLMHHNQSGDKGGGVYGRNAWLIENCTIVDNAGGAPTDGGGLHARDGGTVRNCIVAYNTSENVSVAGVGQTFEACCSAPLLGGSGNFSAAPAFADRPAENYRLAAGSPCIDAGTAATGLEVDLDGLPRPLAGSPSGSPVIDVGAYEFASPDVDSDGDRASNADEAVAGTGLLDSTDVLRVTALWPSGPAGVSVAWDSVPGRFYTLYAATNLPAGPWNAVSNAHDIPAAGRTMQAESAPSDAPTYYRVTARPP